MTSRWIPKTRLTGIFYSVLHQFNMSPSLGWGPLYLFHTHTFPHQPSPSHPSVSPSGHWSPLITKEPLQSLFLALTLVRINSPQESFSVCVCVFQPPWCRMCVGLIGDGIRICCLGQGSSASLCWNPAKAWLFLVSVRLFIYLFLVIYLRRCSLEIYWIIHSKLRRALGVKIDIH